MIGGGLPCAVSPAAENISGYLRRQNQRRIYIKGGGK